jgi:aspartyl-tRNA(Asn)/glutamyl-tRNA(Gln) amidotransferase subunit A
MSAVEIAEAVRTKRLSPVELIEAVLAQVERVNPKVNAIVTLTADQAREQARGAEAAVVRGDALGPLHGVPVTIKDLEVTRGIRTTFGSKLYENFVPDKDHAVVARLREAGAIVIGKTNTPEFGLLPITDNVLFGPSCNPWNLEHNTGGSSGGAGAAVACGMGPIATGSDGGGSIRVPSSFNGIFGIKPHQGRVGVTGTLPGWETLSCVGPMARTVRDAARMLDVIAVPAVGDRWSLPQKAESFETACTREAQGLRLAWSRDLGHVPVEPEVEGICEAAVRRFEELDCKVEEVRLDLEDLSWALQTIVVCETATAREAQYAEWEKVAFPPLLGFLALAERFTFRDLVRAHWAREELWRRLAPVFEGYDALLTPQMPVTAPRNHTLGPDRINGQPIEPLGWLGFTFPFNLTWQPAASLPVGFASDGLPVGLQIVGRRFGEATLLRLASAFEAAFPWQDRRPPAANPA